MKLNKISIDIEKIGNVEIYSYNGYILGFRNKKYSDCMSFFPIVINTKDYDKKLLEVYFDFIDAGWNYSDYDYYPNYDIYFKEYNKVYKDRSKYDIMELIELSSGCNICIIPEYSFELLELIRSLMNEIALKNKEFTIDSVQGHKTTTKRLFLDDDNYIKISINYFEQHTMSYHNTLDEMNDIIKIFKHIFKMLDKNVN